MSEEIRFEISVIWSTIAVVEIIINAMVLYSIFSGKLWKGRGSPIYIISASNLAVDIIQLGIHVIFLLPSTAVGKEYTPWMSSNPHNWNVFFSTVFMFCWYHTTLNQILTALNRVCVICFMCRTFDLTRVVYLAAAVYPTSFILAITTQFLTPCCRFIFEPTIYSYTYEQIKDIPNYSNVIVDIPLNNTSSLVCLFSYSWIFINMRRSRKNLSTVMSPNVTLRRKYKEYRYAMQFCAISVFYLSAWVCFRVFPHVVDANSSKATFSLISLCVIINSGANGFTYLFNNREIQRELRNTYRWFWSPPDTMTFMSNSEIVRKQNAILLRSKISTNCETKDDSSNV